MVRRMVVRDLSLLSVLSSYSLLLFQERRVFIRTHHMCENGQWLLGPSKKSRDIIFANGKSFAVVSTFRRLPFARISNDAWP